MSVKLLVDIGAPHEAGLKNWIERIVTLRIRAALLDAGGDVGEAARALGTSRHTIYRLIKPEFRGEDLEG